MASIDKIVYGGSLMLFVAPTGSTVQPIAFSTSAKLAVSLKTREITSKDSGNWTEKAAGKMDWNVSSDALVNYVSTGNTSSTDELFTALTNRTAIPISFAVATGSSPSWTVDSTKKKFTGTAIITSLDITGGDGDNATYSVSLEGTGVLTMA